MAIFVLDDDGTIEEVVRKAFPDKEIWRYTVSKEFIEDLMKDRDIDLIVIDLVIQREKGKEALYLAKNPNVEGLFVLKRVKEIFPERKPILATKFARDDVFAKALRLGGIPLEIKDLNIAIKKFHEYAPSLSGKIENLKELARKYRQAGYIAVSLKSLRVLELADKFARSKHPILITGEVGTGKDALAKAIAKVYGSPKFISFDIGNYSTELDHLHAELFGVGKGAFTGVSEHKGLFEVIGEGILFLNEIGDLPLPLQGKLLDVLESGYFYKMRTSTPIKFKGKLILATNKNLLQMVEEGLFREDLFNRIFSHHIEIPPLRERREDIPALIKFKAPELKFSDAAMNYLLNKFDYPGNIRTLFRLLERFIDYGLETVQLEDVMMATTLMDTKTRDNRQEIDPNELFEFMLENSLRLQDLEQMLLKSGVKKFGLKWSEDTWGRLGISRAKFFRWKRSGKLPPP